MLLVSPLEISMKPTPLRLTLLAAVAMLAAFPLGLPRTNLGPLQAELQAQQERLLALQAVGKQHQYEARVQREVMLASLDYLSQTSQACDALYDEADALEAAFTQLKEQQLAQGAVSEGPGAEDVEVTSLGPRPAMSSQGGPSTAKPRPPLKKAASSSRKPRSYVWMRSVLPTHIGQPVR